jgi:septal ring factor EnvC (AmiA/AmiB activator)
MNPLLKAMVGTVLPTDWSAKMIKFILVFVLLASVVVGGVLAVRHYENLVKENTELKTELTQIRKDLADLKLQLAQQNKSAEVTVAAVSNNDQAHAQAEVVKTTVTKKRDTRVKVIADNFKDQPKTPQNEQAKTEQISTAQIDSLWETYCDSGLISDQQECKPETPDKPATGEEKRS